MAVQDRLREALRRYVDDDDDWETTERLARAALAAPTQEEARRE